MAPSNLHGLNIVQPVSSEPDNQDLIPPYPELAAQLDLWANISFDNEEPQPLARGGEEDKGDEEHEEIEAARAAIRDGHINVVTGTNVGNNLGHQQQQHAASNAHFPSADLNAFLSSFGVNPFAAPAPPPLQAQTSTVSPSLLQMLAMQAHFQNLKPQTASSPPPSASATSPSTEDTPPSKRARTRKTSIEPPASDTSAATPVTPAEDKRRRNTAASARFRLKKKEREAALEGKAKELETRVNELEKECEGLRRENGWLKGLVVGVTGAAATVPTMESVTAGLKRPRDDGKPEP
ncbi:hypothetical protein ONZ45_g1521 [Pleurotus djamor]|nr:hypothetical protein ONZ45_g1521 [Pleurotus djamor]